jgi:lysozyme
MRIIPKNYALRKTPSFRRFAAFALAVFFIALGLSAEFRYYVRSWLEYPIHYKEYKQFGIRIPSNYTIHGIDVSKWQQRVDWGRIRKMRVGNIRIHFAFMKACEGSWQVDPQFDRNWENAKRNGIIRGAYHFFLPDISPKMQAVRFTNTVRLSPGDLPPVVDVEETRGMNRAQIQRYTKAFMDLLEKYYKVKPILYTNRDFYKNYFAGVKDFEDYPLWIAHYHVSDLDMPNDEKWHFWQHSDRGHVNGINEKVDFNVFYGDSLALRKFCLR